MSAPVKMVQRDGAVLVVSYARFSVSDPMGLRPGDVPATSRAFPGQVRSCPDRLVQQLRPDVPAAASVQATMPGRNVTGRQPYFPDVPGLTVALLQGIAAQLARSRPLRFAPLISGCHPANVQLK